MTIRLPDQNIFDRILGLLGKKRGVRIPTEAYEKFGPYCQLKAFKENYWKALLRSKHEKLPDGYIDLFEIEGFRREVSGSEEISDI